MPRLRGATSGGDHKFKSLCTALVLGGALAVVPVIGAAHAQGAKQERRGDKAKYKQCRDAAKQDGLRGYKRFRSIERCMRDR